MSSRSGMNHFEELGAANIMHITRHKEKIPHQYHQYMEYGVAITDMIVTHQVAQHGCHFPCPISSHPYNFS